MKSPLRILLLGSLFVAASWLTACLKWIPINMEQMNTLFTGFGFVGLVAAFLHERQQAADAESEHVQLLAAMRSQSKNICHGARVSALAASLKWTQAELDKFNVGGLLSKNVEERRNDLRTRVRVIGVQLEKASEITELL
jgi:hypothetical protein